MSTTTHLQAADDARHALRPPIGRESLAFIVPLPDEELGLIAYTYVDHEDVAGTLIMLWGPDGLIVSERSEPESAAGRDFDDWKVGGLEVAHTDPLERFSLRYGGEAVSFDLTAVARHRAYAYGEHRDGCPTWLADDRFEQHLDLQGTLRVGDREIPLDGRVLFRDHSWGTRDWRGPQHWKWIHLAAGESSVHLMEVVHLGRRDIPGFVHRDGVTSGIASFTVDELEFGEDFVHTFMAATIVDEDGRETKVTSRPVVSTLFPAHPALRMNDSTVRCEIAGESGHGHVELLWDSPYAEYHAGNA
jgi:hypothetical protein